MVRALLVCVACWALAAQAQTCTVCGEVRAVREISTAKPAPASTPRAPAAPSTVPALDADPLVGAVVRFEFYDRRNPEGWHLGAAGTPEMQSRLGETTYEVTVVMDGGESRTLRRRDGYRFRVGQRVALRAGELEPN